MNNTPKELQIILDEQNIDKNDAQKLVEAFGGPFEEVGDILATYTNIIVTDGSQREEIKEAREMRLKLRAARSTVENKRKDMKAGIIKEGRAIDSIAKFVKESILPAEEHLQLQEDFAKIQEAERKAKLETERTTELSQFTDDLSIYNLPEMSDEQYATTLKMVKESHALKVADAKRLEDARIKEQKNYEEAQAKLKADKEKAEAKLAIERKKSREAEAKAEAVLEVERAKYREAEAKSKAREEVIAKEKAESEAKEKAIRDKAQADKEASEAAPDKEKLDSLSADLESFRLMHMPVLQTAAARGIRDQVADQIHETVKYIEEEIKKL